MIDDHAAYQALKSRDARFDGVFFVGVTSTGIYCRPVCPAKTPQRRNCRFFGHAGAAEKAGFRPCRRCRPELAPGRAPVDRAQRIAEALARRIDEGLVDDGIGMEEIAAEFGLGSRQLRRIVKRELGVSPIGLKQTRRLLLAKQLLAETALPVTEIAFASGFSSLRRFNAAFRAQYRMPPTQLRRAAGLRSVPAEAQGVARLQLSYRPPYDWEAIRDFLGARVIRDVEWVTAGGYARTVRLGAHAGWIRVTPSPERNALRVEFTPGLLPALPALLGRVKNLFDLAARPDLIAAHLSKDALLRASVAKHPGLRVPGAFDGFEMAVRAILGQQISVKAATTLAGRFAAAFGEKMATPFPELTRLSPRASRVAEAGLAELTRLGIGRRRAETIRTLAQEFASGALKFDPGMDPEPVIAQLASLPGIGPWTAHYLVMRALRWPDAFPKEDLVVRKNLGGVTPRRAEELSRAWRPWRSYAVMHVWKSRPVEA